MSCRIELEQIAEHLAATSHGRRSSLSAHLAACPDCERRVAQLMETERLLGGVGLEVPPEGLWQKVSSRLEPRKGAGRSALTRRRFMVAGATAVLAALVVLQIGPVSPPDEDMALFAEKHQALRPASASQQELPPSALQEIEMNLGFPVLLPRNLPPSWKLVNASRFACLRGLPVAQLHYAGPGGHLSVFQKPMDAGAGPGMGRGRSGGRVGRGLGHGGFRWGRQESQGVFRWGSQSMALSSDGVIRYVVVGDLQPEQLEGIANDLARRGGEKSGG